MEINERRSQRMGPQPGGEQASRAEPTNWGSARSDYGELAYGGRLNDEGMERGWWDRASDEMSSWFGDEDAGRRRRMDERRDRVQDRNRAGGYFGGGYPFGYFPSAYGPNYGTMAAENYVRWQNWRDLRVHDVMTRNVATADPNDSIKTAAQMMLECDCGAIPVTDRRGTMIGMITDRDIAVRVVANGLDPARERVGNCMTHDVFACHKNDSLRSCMSSMSRHQIRRMPIVDDRGRIVGIISQGDLAQHASDNYGTGEQRAMNDVVGAISEPSESAYR